MSGNKVILVGFLLMVLLYVICGLILGLQRY